MKYRSPVRMISALVLGFCLGLMGCAGALGSATGSTGHGHGQLPR